MGTFQQTVFEAVRALQPAIQAADRIARETGRRATGTFSLVFSGKLDVDGDGPIPGGQVEQVVTIEVKDGNVTLDTHPIHNVRFDVAPGLPFELPMPDGIVGGLRDGLRDAARRAAELGDPAARVISHLLEGAGFKATLRKFPGRKDGGPLVSTRAPASPGTLSRLRPFPGRLDGKPAVPAVTPVEEPTPPRE